EPLDTAALVDAAMQRLEQKIKETRAEIIVPTSWPVALGHPGWIEEVWENYISNAIKYGGTPPKIELGATTLPNNTIQFWVKDNGRGLTPEEQSLLFTPFTRLQKARISGHGLGLSIVRRIIEKLDGTVGIISEAGEGSTFYFTLSAGDL
ncbi:MAG: sensor histidine kinase, partial [Chloroflexi bacterium]